MTLSDPLIVRGWFSKQQASALCRTKAAQNRRRASKRWNQLEWSASLDFVISYKRSCGVNDKIAEFYFLQLRWFWLILLVLKIIAAAKYQQSTINDFSRRPRAFGLFWNMRPAIEEKEIIKLMALMMFQAVKRCTLGIRLQNLLNCFIFIRSGRNKISFGFNRRMNELRGRSWVRLKQFGLWILLKSLVITNQMNSPSPAKKPRCLQ